MKLFDKTLFHTPRGHITLITRLNGVYKPCISKLNTRKGHKQSLSQSLSLYFSLSQISLKSLPNHSQMSLIIILNFLKSFGGIPTLDLAKNHAKQEVYWRNSSMGPKPLRSETLRSLLDRTCLDQNT